ncbi:MAG: hypothetical protein F6K10_17790 [Moorea sp. SIO2B7]|nr:hypothetical protein [Moorena sp. SIO2B7]
MSLPPIEPFQRLQITDGVLINSERWRLAHEYHKKRHNIYYQSLNQPGIVKGLGVCPIPAPKDRRAEYRDGRWVQIQPGIAIDHFGNFIVVDKPMDYRLRSEVNESPNMMVYLVVYYVDPDELELKNEPIIVTEKFRIKEKDSHLGEGEVEICRILLTSGEVKLSTPNDVFNPGNNQLDLRYRVQAKWRPQACVNAAIYDEGSGKLRAVFSQYSQPSNLSYLLQSVASIYPKFEVGNREEEVSLQPEYFNQILAYDLLYFRDKQFRFLLRNTSVRNESLSVIKEYLESGGVLLVEISTQGTNIGEITQVKQELQQSLPLYSEQLAENNNEVKEARQLLADLETKLNDKIKKISNLYQEFARKVGTPLKLLETNHLLRTHPFPFAAFPTINEQAIPILIGGGIILALGNLSSAWGWDSNLSLPRETIRTAQEMGINILHFAWRRKQLTQSQLNPRNNAAYTPNG